MKIHRLTVIVPCFNERKTIAILFDSLMKVRLGTEKEVIVVDDGSTDGTTDWLKDYLKSHREVVLVFHKNNKGKGAAIKSALKKATGDYIIIQDADLEYRPENIKYLLEYAEKFSSVAVYGSRNLINNNRSDPLFYFGGVVLTKLANWLFNQKITDLTTGYKLIRRKTLDMINLEENGFSFCAEVTAKLAGKKIKIDEVPITYTPRKFIDGKKIKASDGIRSLYILIKYYFQYSYR